MTYVQYVCVCGASELGLVRCSEINTLIIFYNIIMDMCMYIYIIYILQAYVHRDLLRVHVGDETGCGSMRI